MPLKLHIIDDEGKYIETRLIESDKEASKAAHKSIYHIPDVKYTRVNPPKEREGFDRYFIDGLWEYHEIQTEEETVEEDAQDGSQE